MSDDEKEISLEDSAKAIKDVFMSLGWKDTIILAMLVLFLLFYSFYKKDLYACVDYYENILHPAFAPNITIPFP